MKNSFENTPAHCHDCHKFADCRQAQNMMADTPPVEGWADVCLDVYCANCDGDDGWGTPYEGASDSPTHCAGCGVPIIHELTAEGVEYVRKALTNGGSCCAEVWPTIWADYDVQPKIPVDSIVIPTRFVELCESWAGDINCMLRAVSSTGNLTIGTHRPRGCDTDEKWYLTIWRRLLNDIGYVIRLAEKSGCTDLNDLADLVDFDIWVDEQVARLEWSYRLANWDASDDC